MLQELLVKIAGQLSHHDHRSHQVAYFFPPVEILRELYVYRYPRVWADFVFYPAPNGSRLAL